MLQPEHAVSPETEFELAAALQALSKPGVVFSEPVRDGDRLIITATEYLVRKKIVSARPVATIVVKPGGIEVMPILNIPRLMGRVLAIIAVITWGTVFLLHPPWSPGKGLLYQVRQLIATIHDRPE